uniref:Uncharacterized protein n=1 Tax=Arundo donax TaxID=35708 RepID=A0A0A9EES6_ARUDO
MFIHAAHIKKRSRSCQKPSKITPRLTVAYMYVFYNRIQEQTEKDTPRSSTDYAYAPVPRAAARPSSLAAALAEA